MSTKAVFDAYLNFWTTVVEDSCRRIQTQCSAWRPQNSAKIAETNSFDLEVWGCLGYVPSVYINSCSRALIVFWTSEIVLPTWLTKALLDFARHSPCIFWNHVLHLVAAWCLVAGIHPNISPDCFLRCAEGSFKQIPTWAVNRCQQSILVPL